MKYNYSVQYKMSSLLAVILVTIATTQAANATFKCYKCQLKTEAIECSFDYIAIGTDGYFTVKETGNMTDNSSAVFQYSLGAIEDTCRRESANFDKRKHLRLAVEKNMCFSESTEENHGESVGDSFCWHLVRDCGFYEGQFNCFCKMGLYNDGSMHLVFQYAVIFMFFLDKYI